MNPYQSDVLVLDPDPAIRAVLAAILRRRGLLVTACGTEREARERGLRGGPYAVVMISSNMPEFEKLLEEIAAGDARERPIVIVANSIETPLDGQPADLSLTKPFHFAELDAAISKGWALATGRRTSSARIANASSPSPETDA
jgi:DNA-binding response OmpR family regulator